ncbi:MAG TPA: MipA/OmpV family protein [Ideonella sp.]|nr:MipA/OmpV family protein [Ideonella sp.]
MTRHSRVPTAASAQRAVTLAGLASLTLATLSLLPLAASAQEAATEGGSQWGLGLGAAITRKPYRGIDNDTQALPLILYENRWVSLAGPRLDLKLPSAGPVAFTLRARYAGDGYEADDAPILGGMAERKAGFWVGGTATWRNPIADLSAEWLGDASGKSKGQQFNLTLERGFNAGNFRLTPRVAAKWADRKYVDYYYGVTAAEARSDRAFYEGDATVNLELGLRVAYAFTPKQSAFVDLSGTRLGSAIKDSPLVDRSSESGLRLGYLYRF